MQQPVGTVQLDPVDAIAFASALLASAGASPAAAAVVADHLVASDRAGVRSHGLLRVPQYVHEIAAGEIDPTAQPGLESRRGALVAVDGNRAFGQVAGVFAVGEALAAAREHGVAVVTVRRAGHAGRIGAYVEALAREGYLALAFCSGPRSGHRVAPFGGVQGRLSTNPIAYALPMRDDPIVADFSTSAVPEGVVRRLRDLGLEAPAGALQDADGTPTTDPAVLYAEPPGTILPLGGARFGHKGYALALLVEAMATLLAGEETADASRSGNNLALVAIATDDDLRARAERLAAYVRSAPPADPARPVVLPGDPERQALAERGPAVDLPTWETLVALARERGVPLPVPLER